VHSIDVARAVRFLIEHPQAHGEVFNTANNDTRPMSKQICTMLETAGMRITRWSLPLPTPLLRGLRPLIDHDFVFRMLNRSAAAMWDRIRRDEGLAPDGLIPHLDRESLDYMSGDFIFDNSKLKKLGFEYRYPELESGWRHTLQWYRDNAWIPAVRN
jgi:nucleoside-diphosphate-sugar epimerase